MKNTLSQINQDHEQKECLIEALLTALRWYALTKEKRKGDEEEAVVLLDLVSSLRA